MIPIKTRTPHVTILGAIGTVHGQDLLTKVPWLWVTVVVVAPIGEETLLRGFHFRSWNRSPRDASIAIAVTALLWAALHVQDELILQGQVIVIGLAFGWLLWKTGSTLPTILMHCLLNGAGMFETVLALRA